MKNPIIIALVALAAVLLTLSEANPASAQVVSLCIGNGQVNGRIVTGTPFGDFIDCSVSSGDLVIFGLGEDDWIVAGRGANLDRCDGQEGSGDLAVLPVRCPPTFLGRQGPRTRHSGEGAGIQRTPGVLVSPDSGLRLGDGSKFITQ